MLSSRSLRLPLSVILFCLYLVLPATSGLLAASSDEMFIGSITITGNTRTDGVVIRRELGLTEGDPFHPEDLDVIWDRLEDSGYFAFVEMDYDEDEDGRVDLFIELEEDQTSRFSPLLTYSRRHKYLLGAMVTESNLRGKGEKLDVAAAWFTIQQYQLGWRKPWLFNRRQLSCGLATGWKRAPFVYRPYNYIEWDINGWTRWNPVRDLYLEGTVAYGEFKRVRTSVPLTGFGTGGTVTGGALSDGDVHQRLTFTAELGWDSRNIPYYPERGGFHHLRWRRCTGNGFDSFTEWSLDLRQFVPMTWGHILALRAYGRQVDRPVPLEDRLYWGGPESIRGYPYAIHEGDEGYLLSAEYRWPLFLMPISASGQVVGFGLHFFCDAGDSWLDGEESTQRLLSWGGGVHLNIATLQLRFEIASTEDGDTVFQFEDTFNF
ncbi:MAG: BamA/TamA family outer membrane protein [bacterium]